ncbi:MAG: hypothetical protein MPN21_02665 [Thermoanaerobaculia bacterium]|nr:hypothetical protein [Thermoanaerobaculia bacterium]
MGFKIHGEQRVDGIQTKFLREVAPIPDLEGVDPAERAEHSEEAMHNLTESLRATRDAGDEALAALEAGERDRALSLLREVSAARDELLSGTDLLSQIVAVGLGKNVLEVSQAFLDTGVIDDEERFALSEALREDQLEGWSQALAHEAAVAMRWTEDVEMSGVEWLISQLQEPYMTASLLGIYLGMHQAVRDGIPDVSEHIRDAYEEVGPTPWMYPVADFMIPNLVSVAEKRRDYRRNLDEMRTRLEELTEASDTI